MCLSAPAAAPACASHAHCKLQMVDRIEAAGPEQPLGTQLPVTGAATAQTRTPCPSVAVTCSTPLPVAFLASQWQEEHE